MNDINHIPSGHFDRNGNMICEGDAVLVTRRPHYIDTDYDNEPAEEAQVIWAGDSWILLYAPGVQENLNGYSAKELLVIKPTEQ